MYEKSYIEMILGNIADGSQKIYEPCYPSSPEGITISEDECTFRNDISNTFTDVWIALRVITDNLNELTDSIKRLEPLTSEVKTVYSDEQLVTAINAAERQYRALLREYWQRMKNTQEEPNE